MLFVSWTRFPSMRKSRTLPLTTSASDEPSARWSSSLSVIATSSMACAASVPKTAMPWASPPLRPWKVVPMSCTWLPRIVMRSDAPVTTMPAGTCPDRSVANPVMSNPETTTSCCPSIVTMADRSAGTSNVDPSRTTAAPGAAENVIGEPGLPELVIWTRCG